MTEHAATPTKSSRRPEAFGPELVRRYGFVLGLVALVIFVQSQNSGFLTEANLFNIGAQYSDIIVLAVGMTFVLIAGGFDLSVGAIYAFSAVLSGTIGAHHAGSVGMLAAIGLGAGVGLINGLAVTKLKINPFITTLATAQVVRGFAYLYSHNSSVTPNDPFLENLGSGRLGDVPIPLIVATAAAVFGGVALAFSVFGRRIYAIGGNDEASFLSGIRTDRARTITYVISGTAAGLAGAMYVGRVGSAQASVGELIEFDVIAACLIGGISISGGEGAVWRAVAGVALLAVLQNYFNTQSINDSWVMITKGFIILIAVALDQLTRGGRWQAMRAAISRSFSHHRRPAHPPDGGPVPGVDDEVVEARAGG
ncbi:L-arabinose transport system permease protein AraH [Baekduia alba]|uniref:ABC transporter permease n=1 Tax=Baekduia alba TaxID=2997333 RepID=UPI0023402FD4|nr:ABC transporter permease [Baekduia alba]WCB94912.1 L-arabinose transport system permease protein AraH [Baekduia alba]